MAEISAAQVMKLRKISGQGMMDCKRALGQTNGDIDEAFSLGADDYITKPIVASDVAETIRNKLGNCNSGKKRTLSRLFSP